MGGSLINSNYTFEIISCSLNLSLVVCYWHVPAFSSTFFWRRILVISTFYHNKNFLLPEEA